MFAMSSVGVPAESDRAALARRTESAAVLLGSSFLTSMTELGLTELGAGDETCGVSVRASEFVALLVAILVEM